MMQDADVETLIKRVIALYNRTRSPEITAKLVFVSPANITVSFTGGFCYGCGITEYVEGFMQQFKMLGAGRFELKAGKTRQVDPRTFETDFAVKPK
jgi:hypothetical protein